MVALVAACGGKQLSSGARDGEGGSGPRGSGGAGSGTDRPDDDPSSSGGSSNPSGGTPGTGASSGRGGDTPGSGGEIVTYGGQPPDTFVNLACERPTALEGGFIACGNGYIHRPLRGACSNQARAGDGGAPAVDNAGGASGFPPAELGDPCESNRDCGTDPLTFCGNDAEWSCGRHGSYQCTRGCEKDSDCESGMLCLCGGAQLVGRAPVGLCVRAICKTDADCTPGYFCVSSPGPGWEASFSCQSPQDECGGNDDCPGAQGGSSMGPTCSSQRGGKRVCDQPNCE